MNDFHGGPQCKNSNGGTNRTTTATSLSADALISSAVSEKALAEQWPAFTGRVERRLMAGARDYGDTSFDKSSPDLCEEIEQELFDVVGWGFILWCHMRALREKIYAAGCES